MWSIFSTEFQMYCWMNLWTNIEKHPLDLRQEHTRLHPSVAVHVKLVP